ncbi:MAG: cytochrome c biogenesis protein CcsA [Desulfobacula sp.]|nr:cytochrome c biogenesis protein CcsA [Desulfobacula sp.]
MSLQMADIALQSATFFYFISMVGYSLFLFKQKPGFQKTSFGFIIAAIGLHALSMIVYVWATGDVPIQNLAQSLSLAAFSLGCMFLFFQYQFDLKILGLFVSVLISVIMLMVLAIPEVPVQGNAVLKSVWVYAHIFLVFTGDAALALASGAGILYLLQEKGIKSKHPGFFFKRLPSLDLLDSVGYNCLSTGFALLTVGLVTGFVYAKAIWGQFWSWDPKEVFSVGTWLVYAALLHLRFRSGWRGRRSAIMTIIGFFIILFTFIGVNMLLGGHHQGFTK